jgi:hypothetical protein
MIDMTVISHRPAVTHRRAARPASSFLFQHLSDASRGLSAKG